MIYLTIAGKSIIFLPRIVYMMLFLISGIYTTGNMSILTFYTISITITLKDRSAEVMNTHLTGPKHDFLKGFFSSNTRNDRVYPYSSSLWVYYTPFNESFYQIKKVIRFEYSRFIGSI